MQENKDLQQEKKQEQKATSLIQRLMTTLFKLFLLALYFMIICSIDYKSILALVIIFPVLFIIGLVLIPVLFR